MTGKIVLSGLIGESEAVNIKSVAQQLQSQPEALAFDVYINSAGGEVYEAKYIRDLFTELNKKMPIRMIGQNLVASSATHIFLAVPKEQRFFENNCEFFIHLPSGRVEGTSEEIQQYANEMNEVKEMIIDYYSDALGLSEEVLNQLMARETSFTTEEAKNFNIIQDIIKPQLIFNMSKKTNLTIGDILNNWFNKSPKNEVTFATADGQVVVFPEVNEGEQPTEGTPATIDGAPADGAILMADETTFVFEGGIFKGIEVPAENEIKEETDAELKAEIAEKEAEIEELKEEIEVLKDEIQNMKAEKKEIENALRSVKSPAMNVAPTERVSKEESNNTVRTIKRKK